MENMVLGVIGFVLFCVYDINSIIWKIKFVHLFFLFGLIGISISTTSAIWSYRDVIIANFNQNFGWLALTLIFMALLIHALFFALPFEKTYVKDAPKMVHTLGVYALCRHPGVLWFIGFYLSLYGFIKQSEILVMSIIFSVLNLLYIALQDIWIFPKTFVDYDAYKKKSPFLIPNLSSTRLFLSTIMHKTEDNL